MCINIQKGTDEHRAFNQCNNQDRSRCSSLMRSKEIHPADDAEKKPSNFRIFNFSWLEKLTDPASLFPQKNKLWSSKRYFHAAALNKEHSATTAPLIQNELQADMQSFFDEFAALMPVVAYSYGLNGIQNGYSQSMGEIANHHLAEQNLKNLPTERAQMEVAVAQTIESWMKSEHTEVGSRLLAISPRGTKPEGYPGLNKKNYVFINIFEKDDNGFLLRQYRSYDPNDKLPIVQAQVLSTLPSSEVYASPTQYKRKDLQTINTLISLEPQIDLARIESIIYADKKDWAVDIDVQLPKLDAHSYHRVVSQAINFCLQQFSEMTASDSIPDTAIQDFDILLTTVKDSLTKWVETHALNYESKEEAHSLDFDTILAVWQTRCAKENGEQLNKEQHHLLKGFENITALNPSLPLKGLTSWAHCIVGTPTSLLKLQNPEMLNALKMNQLSHGELANFIGKERAALWKTGTCLRCGNTGLVGECSICFHCELELGGQLSASENMLENAKDQLLSTLSGEEINKAKVLFNKLSKLVLRETVSFEQLLHGDFVNPTAEIDSDLEPLFNRIFYAHNGLAELEIVVAELSTKNNISEHKNSDLLFNAQNSQSSAVITA